MYVIQDCSILLKAQTFIKLFSEICGKFVKSFTDKLLSNFLKSESTTCHFNFGFEQQPL